MPQFLIRSFDLNNKYGYETRDCVTLPRNQNESYVPWAITLDSKVVYALTGEHHGFNARLGLRPYDAIVSQDRRRLAELALGLNALADAKFTGQAVRLVSEGIKAYLDRHVFDNGFKDGVFKNVGHYLYTKSIDKTSNVETIGKGFGRIGEENPSTLQADGVLKGIYVTLENGRLDQQLAIHDAIGRKVLADDNSVLETHTVKLYRMWGEFLREDWFDDTAKRGRSNVTPKPGATTVGGIVKNSQANQIGTVAIDRNRGVDMFSRDNNRTRHPPADAYYDEVDIRNLLFGAGISGTTGTLMQAALAFAPAQIRMGTELLKQYVLAIIGYLVGGGMHSYHETMAVAQKAQIPYVPGKYAESLPDSFRNSEQFKTWSADYYDIVELGSLHWMYNTGAPPSHLNKNLKVAVK